MHRCVLNLHFVICSGFGPAVRAVLAGTAWFDSPRSPADTQTAAPSGGQLGSVVDYSPASDFPPLKIRFQVCL